jgi:ABC-2 type transport system ATP-binding protein
MIEVSSLTKTYGKKRGIDRISFMVDEGEIVGFLGPNGAGKTTTMNIITGYLSANSGAARIGGIDVLEDPVAAKKKIGYLPEQPPLYLDMTVEEYLNFIYDLKRVTELKRKKHLDEICELVGLKDHYKRLIRNLSKGYKQRVGLSLALVGNPEVLILDEPTVGLDPKQIIEIRNVIKNLGKNRTIILSTHILQEVSAICERVLVINKDKSSPTTSPKTCRL